MKKIILTFFAAILITTSFSQDRSKEQLHAAMLYNFIKYIQWPTDGSGDFVIGVIGDQGVFNTLKTLYDGKTKGNQKYVIKKLSSAAEAATCHVVYVGSSKSKDFETVKNSVTGKSVLTITDGTGLAEQGSCINFKLVDGRLKFELNQNQCSVANLKVSGQLSSMAILI